MLPLTTHTGIAVPLRRSNVDTDQIVSSRFLTRMSRHGYGDALFSAWRDNPSFVLNQPAYQNATILIAGSDFGIGSSREQAAWALQDYGFRVLFSPRFGDIFRNNCGNVGILPGVVSSQDYERLMDIVEGSPGTKLRINLKRKTIHLKDESESFAAFDVPQFLRHHLMEGVDDIDATLRCESEIMRYEGGRHHFRIPMHEIR